MTNYPEQESVMRAISEMNLNAMVENGLVETKIVDGEMMYRFVGGKK